MGLLETIVVFAIDGEVGGNGFVLSDLLKLDVGSVHQSLALFLGRGRDTLTCSL